MIYRPVGWRSEPKNQDPPKTGWQVHPDGPTHKMFTWRMFCKCEKCNEEIDRQGTGKPHPGLAVCHVCDGKEKHVPEHIARARQRAVDQQTFRQNFGDRAKRDLLP